MEKSLKRAFKLLDAVTKKRYIDCTQYEVNTPEYCRCMGFEPLRPDFKSSHYKPMKERKLISAEEAKELTRKVTDVQLEMVNQEIKKAADEGKRKCYIYTGLERETIDTIKEAGYEIYTHPSIGIQKEGLYYTISWYNN